MKQRETDTGDEREREKKKNLEEAKFRFLVQPVSCSVKKNRSTSLFFSFTSHTQNSY
jgi:hypothetical protein